MTTFFDNLEQTDKFYVEYRVSFSKNLLPLHSSALTSRIRRHRDTLQTMPSTASTSRYNGFQPISISYPPSSSTSSKRSSPSPHFLWIKPHALAKPSTQAKTAARIEEQDLPPNRTLFVANLSVDSTEDELKFVFGEWGVVEKVVIRRAEAGQGMDSWKGDEDEEDEKDSDDDDEKMSEDEQDQEGKETQMDTESATKPTGRDGAEAGGRRRRVRKNQRTAPVSKIPTIHPLPSLTPRSSPYLPSNSSAFVIYLDVLSLKRCLNLASTRPTKAIPLQTLEERNKNKTGLDYYRSLHSTLRPSLNDIKLHADSSLAVFDHFSNLAKQKASSGPIVDEDGFTLVVRGGAYGRTAGKGAAGVGIASRRFVLESKKVKAPLAWEGGKRKDGDRVDLTQTAELDAREGLDRGKGRKKGKVLDGFYKFQRNERKRQGECFYCPLFPQGLFSMRLHR